MEIESAAILNEIYECYQKKEDLPRWVVNEIGFWDKGGRYYLYSENETTTSKMIRRPSSAHPYSVVKHLNTHKYKKSYLEIDNQLLTAMENQNNQDLMRSILYYKKDRNLLNEAELRQLKLTEIIEMV